MFSKCIVYTSLIRDPKYVILKEKNVQIYFLNT